VNKQLISAIKNKLVLRFVYNGKPRVVEPQTYGISTAGKEVLRARQVGGGSRSGQSQLAKLFEVAKVSSFQKTSRHFSGALPQHNPEDSAMKKVFATLPRPKRSGAKKTKRSIHLVAKI